MLTFKEQQGFTLVELSIVLVLVGLLVAGAMSGRSLLERSRVESVIREVQAYKSGFDQFTSKYTALPGDMADAYTMFDGTDAVCGTSANCNGNGNSLIDSLQESLRAWQHMQLAGMVDGSFTGAASGGNNYVPGTNLPKSAVTDGAGYNITTVASAIYTGSFVGHAIRLATRDTTTTFAGPAIKVADALTTDQKIDDGIAASGMIVAEDSAGASNCVDASNVYVVDENTNGGTAQCRVTFLLQKTY